MWSKTQNSFRFPENFPGGDPNNKANGNTMGSLVSHANKDGIKDKKKENRKWVFSGDCKDQVWHKLRCALCSFYNLSKTWKVSPLA